MFLFPVVVDDYVVGIVYDLFLVLVLLFILVFRVFGVVVAAAGEAAVPVVVAVGVVILVGFVVLVVFVVVVVVVVVIVVVAGGA